MNFLDRGQPPVFKENKKTKKGGLRKILLVLFLLFVAWGFVVLIAFMQFVSSSIDGMVFLKSAKTESYAFHFESASESLKNAGEAFEEADRMYFFVSTLRPVPVIGKKVSQAGKLARAGGKASKALSSVMLIGNDVLRLAGVDEDYFEQVENGKAPQVSFSDLSSNTKKHILERLQASSKDLFIISKQIDVIESELNELSLEESTLPYLGELSEVRGELLELESALSKLSLFVHVFPAFSGLDNEQTYLVLFLNNTELRPGGGFIGTYGLMDIKNGDLLSLETEDVYALDDRAAEFIEKKAPYPLQKYNGADKWFFRDGNWSPDFAWSARHLIEQFVFESKSLSDEQKEQVATSEKIDGVIGFTTTFASDLLKVTGPIAVGSQTFNSSNIADKLEYQVEFAFKDQGIPVSQRKDILSDLVEKMVDKMFDLPISSWASVLASSENSLKTKQLLLFHSDEAIQKVLAQVGWGGVVDPHTKDVQFVVDANLASLKSDPAVKRAVTYEIEKNTSGDFIGRTRIVYNHTGSFDWKTTRYRTYTRLLVPKGSKLIRVTGSKENDATKNPNNLASAADEFEELGLAAFGAFTSVEPGRTQELVFEYELASSVQKAIKKGVYDLSVFKQAGADNHTLTVDLDFGKNVTNAVPSEKSQEWGDDRYRLNTILDQDLIFEVRL
jgi:hypothetical protein